MMVKTAIEFVKVEKMSFLHLIWQFYVRMGLLREEGATHLKKGET